MKRPRAEKESVRSLSDNMKLISQEISDLQFRQQKMNTSQYKDKRILELPIYEQPNIVYRRHHMALNGTTLRDNIEVFNPKRAGSDIFRTWKKLREYGMKNYFTEREYIDTFPKVVEGEAADQLEDMVNSDYNLEKILKFWAGIYGGKQSLQSERHQIQTFTRKKGEKLKVAMLRAQVIIDRLEIQHDSAAWPTVRNIFLRDTLFRIITPAVNKHLQAVEERHEDDGFRADFEQLLKAANYHETSQDKAPLTDWPPETAAVLDQMAYRDAIHHPVTMPVTMTVPINQAGWQQQKPQSMDTGGYGLWTPPQPAQPVQPQPGFQQSPGYQHQQGFQTQPGYQQPYQRGQSPKRTYDEMNRGRSQNQGFNANRNQSPGYNNNRQRFQSPGSQPHQGYPQQPPQPQQPGQRPYSKDRNYQRSGSNNNGYNNNNDRRGRSASNGRNGNGRSYSNNDRYNNQNRSQSKERQDYHQNSNEQQQDSNRSQSYERRQRDEHQQRGQRHQTPIRPQANMDDVPMDPPKQDINIITGHNNAYYKCNATSCKRHNFHEIDAVYWAQKKKDPKNGTFACPDKKKENY